MERKYSVKEIDQMRAAVAEMLQWRADATRIEEYLRTYMLNGTTPAELAKAAAAATRRWRESVRIAAEQRMAIESAMKKATA